MEKTNKFSKETQNKIACFLKEEFDKLKTNHQEELQKRNMKRKHTDKKRQKLSQKVEAILSIHSLDADVKDVLLSLQQEIKDFT